MKELLWAFSALRDITLLDLTFLLNSTQVQLLMYDQAWNKYQRSLPKKYRSTVIYGHDSKRGLQEEKYSIGIDTGCLKGGKLTAVIVEGGESAHSYRLAHVGCKDGR